MRSYLLDTCICVFLFRGKHNIQNRLNEIGCHNCYISEVTIAELKYGIEKCGNPLQEAEKLSRFIEKVNIVPFSEAINLYAFEKARLNKLGTPIEDFDLLIGCSALARNLIMVTDNEKHFNRIQNLSIENWISNQSK